MSLPTNQMIDSDVRLSRDLFITTPNQAEYSVRYVANTFSCYRQHTTIHIVLSKISIFTRIRTRSIVEENFFYVRSSGRYASVEYFSTNKTYSMLQLCLWRNHGDHNVRIDTGWSCYASGLSSTGWVWRRTTLNRCVTSASPA